MSKKITHNKIAFTLAEILITLSIIGVVAAITIPVLMQKQQEKATVVALKKAHSALSEAYTLAVKDNGAPSTWTLGDDWTNQGAQMISDILSPYLNITKDCKTTEVGCAPQDYYKRLNGDTWINLYAVPNTARLELADGSLLSFVPYKYNSGIASYFGFIYVDVNGAKKPNQEGVDWFLFVLTDRGIMPTGTADNKGLYTFADYCGKSGALGEGCTAWVIYNENLDYKKCPDKLSWDGLKTCP